MQPCDRTSLTTSGTSTCPRCTAIRSPTDAAPRFQVIETWSELFTPATSPSKSCVVALAVLTVVGAGVGDAWPRRGVSTESPSDAHELRGTKATTKSVASADLQVTSEP